MIRTAKIDDLQRICEIEKSSFTTDAWSDISIEVEFYKEYAHIFVYEEERNVIAYIIIWALTEEAEIMTFAVDPEYRGRGIATELLEKALSRFKDRDWFLEVEAGNDNAIKLYTNAGFIISGTIKDYYGSGRDALRMAKLRRQA